MPNKKVYDLEKEGAEIQSRMWYIIKNKTETKHYFKVTVIVFLADLSSFIDEKQRSENITPGQKIVFTSMHFLLYVGLAFCGTTHFWEGIFVTKLR